MDRIVAVVVVDGRATVGFAARVTFKGPIAGKPAPTGIAQGLRIVVNLWEPACRRLALSHKHNQLAVPPLPAYSPPRNPSPSRNLPMSKKPKKHGPNKAKSIIAQPLFRCRQEQPDKGKGSYRREAFQSRDWEASYFLAA